MDNTLHIVIGSGPLGTTIAEQLATSGHRVRVITRSGTGLDHPAVEKVAADMSDAAAAQRAVVGAAVVYHCGNPPYTKWAKLWPPLQAAVLAATRQTGAVLVMSDNLYMYSPSDQPLRADSPMEPSTRKGRVRARMAHDLFAEGVRVTAVRGADFYGPCVEASLVGERFVARLLAGKAPSTLGRADLAHSYTYIGDMAAAMIAVGADERAWGRPWHAPAVTLTQQEMADALADAAGIAHRGVKTVGALTLRALGVFVPVIREIAEMHEQTDRPFTSDCSPIADALGLTPTPVAEAAAQTVAWWRRRAPGADGSAVVLPVEVADAPGQ